MSHSNWTKSEVLSTLEIFYMESSKDVRWLNYPGMVVFRVLFNVEALQTQYNIWTVDKQFFILANFKFVWSSEEVMIALPDFNIIPWTSTWFKL